MLYPNTSRLVCTLAFTTMLAGCGDVAPAAVQEPQGDFAAPINAVAPVPAKLVPLGQSGAGLGFEITVTSVEQRSRVGAASSRKAGPTETYVIVLYDLKNTSRRPIASEDRPEVTLIDGNGQAYSDDRAAAFSFTENGLGDAYEALNPNVTAKRASVWKVDKAAFQRASWKLLVAGDPQIKFALQ